MKPNKKVIAIILIFLIIFIAGFFYRGFYGTPWEKASAQKAMQNHLDSKYSEKMKIDFVNYGVDPPEYYGSAHPVDNPKVTFSISDTNGKIFDQYCTALWEYQMKIFLLENIDAKYLDNIDIIVNILPDRSIYDNITGSVPNYRTVENSLYSTTEINFECNYGFNNSNKESQYELMFNILTTVNKLQKFYLINFYYDDSINNHFNIMYNDLANIKEPSDISKYHV